MGLYAAPGQPGSLVSVQDRYGNYIGGEFVPPSKGEYFENISPVTGRPFTEIARSPPRTSTSRSTPPTAPSARWGRTSVAERANILNKIADRIEDNLEMLAVAETWDNGKPVRETLAADLPLAVDHFRYFAGAIRAQEGSISEIDDDTVAYHFHEPLGRGRADHPVELPHPDGRLEAGARAGRRQLRRAQAGRADARGRSSS